METKHTPGPQIISYKPRSARVSRVAESDLGRAAAHVNMTNAVDGRPEFNVSFTDEKTGRVFEVLLDAETSERMARMVMLGGGRGMNALRAKFAPQAVAPSPTPDERA